MRRMPASGGRTKVPLVVTTTALRFRGVGCVRLSSHLNLTKEEKEFLNVVVIKMAVHAFLMVNLMGKD
jgi:hypothetical protein